MNLVLTFIVGSAGGWIAYWLGIPAGALIGSLVAVSVLRLVGGPVRQIPLGMRRAAQMVVGATLGVSFGWTQLLASDMLLPALALTAVLFGMSVAVSWAVVSRTGWPWSTTLLCTAPAGMTELSLSAHAMGVDASVVAAMHLARIATVITVVPWLVRWFG